MADQGSAIRAWYAEYGGKEWERLEATLHGRVKYAIHRRYLDAAIEPGMRVADVGCGPGRFAIDTISAGAKVTLIDLSPDQLAEAKRRVADAGVSDGAEAVIEADVRDLSAIKDASFDAVICYGGAISYAYDGYQDAVRELARIAKPGAPILVSVMTLVGTMRLLAILDADATLYDWSDHLPEIDWDSDDVVLTVPASNEFHLPMALFNAPGLEAALNTAGCDVERFAVANPLTNMGQPHDKMTASPAAEARMIELELALCERPGLRDDGEHIIAVARKRP